MQENRDFGDKVIRFDYWVNRIEELDILENKIKLFKEGIDLLKVYGVRFPHFQPVIHKVNNLIYASFVVDKINGQSVYETNITEEIKQELTAYCVAVANYVKENGTSGLLHIDLSIIQLMWGHPNQTSEADHLYHVDLEASNIINVTDPYHIDYIDLYKKLTIKRLLSEIIAIEAEKQIELLDAKEVLISAYKIISGGKLPGNNLGGYKKDNEGKYIFPDDK